MSDFRLPDADWKNNGSECPAFGVFAITDNAVVGGKNILQGSQPSTTFTRNYGVNDEFIISASGYGGAYTHGIVRVLYDTGTPAAGETWGAKPSQWTASKGFPGLTVLGIVDSTAQIMLARVEPYDTIIGKLTGSLVDGGNTVNVWAGVPGSEAAIASWTVTAYPWFDVGSCTYPVSTSAKVVCKYIAGRWRIMPLPWDRTQISGYSGSTKQYLAHDTSGCLLWETPSAC